MSRWNDPWDYVFDVEVEGEKFARVEVRGESLEKRGYWSPSWEPGDFAFYVHEASGIVTASPSDLLNWIATLKGVTNGVSD